MYIFMMYYNQTSINLFRAWYDSQPVCIVFIVNIWYLRVLAMYKKVLSWTKSIMDKSVFLHWWFYFDLQYYLISGGTNNVLHTSVKKILCTLWSLALAKKSCNSISNSRAQVSRLLFLVNMIGDKIEEICSDEKLSVEEVT